ncbi:membrane protein insertase YidC [Jiangella asiatica]|uniref:Membrane protein insertase YidC n=1 Tax=Jiangella asiatica TaxID=2530372 RepID=A0A4R5CJZ2_9ACTN|nr:membrane protein insertase YidC [Jiangella asiatica]TDD97742.1 membrane protein insertase YidC [Jiangella asiatica]
MFALLDTPALVVSDVVMTIACAIEPALGEAATAGAIVALTLTVRLLLLPLGVRAARVASARLALRPRELELRRRFHDRPARLRHELHLLRERHGIRPLAGVAPLLAQAPIFMVLYRLFTSPTLNGHANALFTHVLLGVPLSDRWLADLSTGLLPPDVIVFGVVFVLLVAVAWWSSTQARRAASGATATGMDLGTVPAEVERAQRVASRLTTLLPYGTVVAAMFVPLAAALYLLTTTTLAACERWALTHGSGPAVVSGPSTG